MMTAPSGAGAAGQQHRPGRPAEQTILGSLVAGARTVADSSEAK